MNDGVLWAVSMSYLACNLSRGSASISSAADNRRANCVFKGNRQYPLWQQKVTD